MPYFKYCGVVVVVVIVVVVVVVFLGVCLGLFVCFVVVF